MIGGKTDIIYGVLYTGEEALEMAGLVLFTYTLLSFLARSQVLVAMFDDVDGEEAASFVESDPVGPHDRFR